MVSSCRMPIVLKIVNYQDINHNKWAHANIANSRARLVLILQLLVVLVNNQAVKYLLKTVSHSSYIKISVYGNVHHKHFNQLMTCLV